MNLVFNELSVFPLSGHIEVALKRFKEFLRTFQEAKSKYGFTHIRFPYDFSSLQVTTDKNFIQFISEINDKTIKSLLLDLCKKPFTDDILGADLDKYFESSYSIIVDKNIDLEIPDSPVGLPVAYIQSKPSISLTSHDFWKQRKFILKATSDTNEFITFEVYNISVKEDVYSNELTEWVNKYFSLEIVSIEMLRLYLSYNKYNVSFTDGFMDELMKWKNEDSKTFQYILVLMKDVEIHPFTRGMGQTENLKNRGKEASKRVNIKDRLSYIVENDTVNFIACIGHYKFH